MTDSPVIIFDGVCNFCNQSVNIILKQDKRQVFTFAANQSDSGQNLLSKFSVPVSDISTLYLYEDGKLYQKSTAVLRIARKLGFPWIILYAGMLIPRPIRDFLYSWVARNRYKWFGKRETCRIPTPEERARFI